MTRPRQSSDSCRELSITSWHRNWLSGLRCARWRVHPGLTRTEKHECTRANRNHYDPCSGTAGPIALVAVSLARRYRARRGVDPRRARGHDGRQRVVSPHGEGQRHRPHRRRHRHGGGVLYRRGVLGRVVLRSSDGPVRAAQPVHPDSRGVSDCHRRDGIRLRALVFLHRALLHRLRHRGRIRRHQFGDRRVDPCACARSRGSGDQRDILAGFGRRGRRCAGPSGYVELPGQHRMAARIRHRCHLRHFCPSGPAQRSGKSTLVVHSRA